MSSKMLSLYDYLGRPAGKALGWAVAKQARKIDANVETRIIENPAYKGVVNLYCEDLLKSFFGNPAFKVLIDYDEKQYRERQVRKKLWGR